MTPIFTREGSGSERLIKLPKVTQPVMMEIRIRIQVWSQSLALFMLLCAWDRGGGGESLDEGERGTGQAWEGFTGCSGVGRA